MRWAPPTSSADYDGHTVVNTAYARLDNLNSDQQASASIPLQVPTTLASTIGKTITPGTAIAVAGTAVTVNLDATNSSNRAVDALVIQDPVDVTHPSTVFGYSAVTGITAPTWPTGADLVQVDWYDTAWHLGTPQATIGIPTGATASTITGLRFTFTSTSGGIVRDAHAVVAVATALRSNVSTINPSVTATNDALSWVAFGPDSSTPVVDAATWSSTR